MEPAGGRVAGGLRAGDEKGDGSVTFHGVPGDMSEGAATLNCKGTGPH
jgi:hypothetical protein